MRHRTSNAQLVYPTVSINSCIGSSCYPSTHSCFTDQSKSMFDDVRPGYFVAKKLGRTLPVGPMQSESWEREYFGATMSCIAEYWDGSQWVPNYYSASATNAVPRILRQDQLNDPGMPVVNESLLVQKALADAQTNAWDVLTFVAEFHKTVGLLSTAQRRWWSHFEKVFKATKSRLRDIRNVGDVFSEVWLEYRFGLRPIIYDIQAINETLRRLEEGIPALSRGWATDVGETMSHGSSTYGALTAAYVQGTLPVTENVLGASGTSTTHSWVWTRTLTGRASVGVTVETRGLTQVDIPVTIWELTPWSVFIDYFLNIGDILSAFSPTATGDLAYATYSTELVDVVTQTSTWALEDGGGFRWPSQSISTGTYIERHTQKSRKVVVPTPSLQLSFDLDLSQVFDLIAVAWGYRRRAHSLLKSLASRR